MRGCKVYMGARVYMGVGLHGCCVHMSTRLCMGAGSEWVQGALGMPGCAWVQGSVWVPGAHGCPPDYPICSIASGCERSLARALCVMPKKPRVSWVNIKNKGVQRHRRAPGAGAASRPCPPRPTATTPQRPKRHRDLAVPHLIAPPPSSQLPTSLSPGAWRTERWPRWTRILPLPRCSPGPFPCSA